MDYTKLAAELIKQTRRLQHFKSQQSLGQAIRGQAFILWYIADNGGEVLPSDISESMQVSSARIAQALNSIEDKGWITRRIDPLDRRRILVRLTPEGEAIACQHLQAVEAHVTHALSLLGEADAKEYVRLTSKLADRLTKTTLDQE
ncbi:MAG TPA: MarR family transcriptional regulator [Tissierellia bacterium]|nr:MarR family transcriptional regulator [Tissierellia bacterium]